MGDFPCVTVPFTSAIPAQTIQGDGQKAGYRRIEEKPRDGCPTGHDAGASALPGSITGGANQDRGTQTPPPGTGVEC